MFVTPVEENSRGRDLHTRIATLKLSLDYPSIADGDYSLECFTEWLRMVGNDES